MAPRVDIKPSLEVVKEILSHSRSSPLAPNLVPLCVSIPADLLTPSLVYLKISAKSKSKLSFLLESAATTETIGRYSFVGADPRKVIKTGPGHGPAVDPLPLLTDELSQYREASIPGLILPPMTGGAVGYVGYDCVRYFEPRTARPMKDVLKVPESLFMLFDTVIAFDHFFQTIKIITYIHVPKSLEADLSSLPALYSHASQTLKDNVDLLLHPDIPFPAQPPIELNQQYTSNIGQSGYESHVRNLKVHIQKGDIIQAVPSQRFSRPTSIHPFNIYRHLRTVNPSPYLFYIDCGGAFQLVGASPELLVKAEKGRIITHPIAGTVKRGDTPKADEALAEMLRNSLKDRAEHVMLVDLARNDINRVCDPFTTTVDHLMVVQKFSHVQHLVSQVSGVLRPDQSRFAAFRSIFPAGTVSGAPKVRAMELIAELEGEKRGVYAGAVGYFGYDTVHFDSDQTSDESSSSADTTAASASATPQIQPHTQTQQPSSSSSSLLLKQPRLEQGAMDTCIALRTMLVKDGVAYLQAGGGIVWDSDPYDEWMETINKLGANMQCISGAEERYSGEEKGLLGSR